MPVEDLKADDIQWQSEDAPPATAECSEVLSVALSELHNAQRTNKRRRPSTASKPEVRDNMMEGSASEFESLDEGCYRLRFDKAGIQLDVERLRRERHALWGELTVRCDIAGARTVNGTLGLADCNLTSQSARQQRAKWLAERANTTAEELDWTAVIEEFAQRVIAAEREGTPALSLRDVECDPQRQTTETVAGLPLLLHHPQIIFGAGGSMKSLLALNIGGELDNRGIRTLLVDWELSEYDHRNRLSRLFGETMPGLKYVRADRPLVHEMDRLRRIIREDGIRFVIFDSAGFACDGPPEAAETALNYFRAVRQLGDIGSLHIAHQTKSTDGDRTPFGSIFWFNSARSIWFVKSSEASEPTIQVVGAFHRKANLGAIHSAVGFRATFSEGRIDIENMDVSDVGDLATTLPIKQRMRNLLRGGAMTPAAIATELDAKEGSITRIQRRERAMFTLVRNDDGPTTIGLLQKGQPEQ